MRFIAIVLLVGCTQVVEQVAEPDDLAGLAEDYCAAHPEWPCGKVYQCDTPADNPLGLVEVCIPQFMDVSAAEAVYGSCELSTDPRLKSVNLCWWCCGSGCGPGCNSYSGCFCDPDAPGMPDARAFPPIPWP